GRLHTQLLLDHTGVGAELKVVARLVPRFVVTRSALLVDEVDDASNLDLTELDLERPLHSKVLIVKPERLLVRPDLRVVPDVPGRLLQPDPVPARYESEEHTSELQSRENLVCRLLLEKKKYRNA